MSKPYELPAEVATVLAQLCCYAGALPQGAPTSPIVANMICTRFDNELRRLAADHRCVVTRYADDITFSSNLKDFPPALASRDLAPNGFITSIGHALTHVVRDNGFTINRDKSRLLHHNQSQNVTGVVVNEKMNVSRRLRDQVRSMLHAWDRFGYVAAAEVWHAQYDTKRRTGPSRPSFRRVVAGKLAHMKMIKSVDDPSYRALHGKYSRLIGAPTVENALWILEGSEDAGTGFLLDGFGLVTCFHVVENAPVIAFQPDNTSLRYPVIIRHALPEIDLAICSLEGAPSGHSLKISDRAFATGGRVRVIGYPDWNPGNSMFDANGSIIAVRRFFGAGYALIDTPTRRGNSGGPVLDSRGRVIGVLRTGTRWIGDHDPAGDEHGVLAADALAVVQGAGPDGARASPADAS